MTTLTEVSKIEAFFKSNLNKTGLTAWVIGAFYAGATEFTTHTFSVPAFLAFALGGLALVFLPDNTVVETDVKNIVLDTYSAVEGKSALTQVPLVLSDVSKFAADLKTALEANTAATTANTVANTPVAK